MESVNTTQTMPQQNLKNNTNLKITAAKAKA